MRQRFRAIEPTKPLGATSQPARPSSGMMSRLAARKIGADRIGCRSSLPISGHTELEDRGNRFRQTISDGACNEVLQRTGSVGR